MQVSPKCVRSACLSCVTNVSKGSVSSHMAREFPYSGEACCELLYPVIDLLKLTCFFHAGSGRRSASRCHRCRAAPQCNALHGSASGVKAATHGAVPCRAATQRTPCSVKELCNKSFVMHHLDGSFSLDRAVLLLHVILTFRIYRQNTMRFMYWQ